MKKRIFGKNEKIEDLRKELVGKKVSVKYYKYEFYISGVYYSGDKRKRILVRIKICSYYYINLVLNSELWDLV